MQVQVIVNPIAGSGRALRSAEQLERQLAEAGIDVHLMRTEGPRHATELAERARNNGADVVVAAGGDGTLNEVVHAYAGPEGPLPGPALCLLPVGTGGDFRRTLGFSESVEDTASRIQRRRVKPLDLGIVEVTNDRGHPERRCFINVMSFGVGGLTDRFVNQGPKWIGGKAAFFWGALRATATYRSTPVEVRVDGEVFLTAPIINVAVANGRYFGGGMKIAPDADPSDGLLDVVAIADRSKLETLALTADIYRGTHVKRRGITLCRGRVVEARATRPGAEVLVDLDGETPGRLPLRAEIAPGALHVLV